MKNFLTVFSLCLAVMVVGTGCLKDKYQDDNLSNPTIDKSIKIIEIAGPVQTSTSFTSYYALNFNAAASDTTANVVVVRLASDQKAAEDIQVTLELAPDLLEAYNDSLGTEYEMLSPSMHTLSNNLVVTIPKGEREGFLTITAIPNNLVGGEYALAFRIKSVSNSAYRISGNFNNQVVIIGVKNKYDGVWRATGSMTDAVNPALVGYFPLDWELITNGSNSVVVSDLDYLGFPGHIISTGSGLSYYGNFGLIVTFDPATDKVTSVTNYYGQPASNGRSAQLDPTGENQYSIINGVPTIKIKYFMLQPGTTIRTRFDETWVYLRPRD